MTLSLQSVVRFAASTMDNSYNFTGLTPYTEYSVSIASVLNSCTGTPNTIMVTTVEAGVPNSELCNSYNTAASVLPDIYA